MSVEDKEREFYFQIIQLLLNQNRELIQLLVDQAGKNQLPPMPPIDVTDIMNNIFKKKTDSDLT